MNSDRGNTFVIIANLGKNAGNRMLLMPCLNNVVFHLIHANVRILTQLVGI